MDHRSVRRSGWRPLFYPPTGPHLRETAPSRSHMAVISQYQRIAILYLTPSSQGTGGMPRGAPETVRETGAAATSPPEENSSESTLEGGKRFSPSGKAVTPH